ncbi:recombinase family protein [Patescibacteria group bacterium]|nr:recombinase family protein [Patescibacteria group bacterium]
MIVYIWMFTGTSIDILTQKLGNFYINFMLNYFLYARKSTDVEDKQVRSIDDQLAVLRSIARDEGLSVVSEFVEKQSAKTPGRPMFNGMLDRIEKGEAQGILCWKLDRLARNPIDAARVQWLLQQGVITHIRTSDRSYYPSDNVILMGFEFGMANQYIRDLSQNTKRALLEKAKRGEYPGPAPVGYLNDPRTKTVVIDRRKAKAMRAAFELYAENRSTLTDVSAFLAKNGIIADTGSLLRKDRITYILSNPFYTGLFRYAGEIYEGKHQPLVPKKLWDKVQEVLESRSRPRESGKNDPAPLCGLLRCAECGCSITAEEKTKRQKNGNVHHYTYYHCTKKRGPCSEPSIRGEELEGQLTSILKEYALPKEWALELSKMADRDEEEALQSVAASSQAVKAELMAVSQKLKRLRSLYIDEDISQEEYLADKEELLSRKKTLEGKLADLKGGRIGWLEPLRGWIKDASNVDEIAVSPSLQDKKSSAQKIFGSNLSLKNRRIEFNPIKPYAALRAAREKIGQIDESLIFVRREGFEPSKA